MLKLRLQLLLDRLRDRRGFTLVEVLVAMVTGVIVTGALFAILEYSVRQGARLSAVAQATQVSRTAMTHVVDELRSACLSSGFTPIIANGESAKSSTPSKLIFVNGYDEKTEKEKEPPAELPANGIHKDVIEYNEATKQLVDKTYIATSNAPTETFEKYTFPASPSSTVKLAENIAKVEEKPIFEYFKYATKSSTETNSAASTLEEKESLTPKSTSVMTEAGANTAASVVVRFKAGPYEKDARLSASGEKGTFAEQTSQTLFSFSAPNSETTIEAAPCE
ncbi:MAG TPA: type II secretion system protein [Solirubrobacteraceae bacterium]|jgi:prepilin-type N-terminal cleavage/methylation domain-containing protein|nr:type II secretion system protein [Solirubrobacteraceae bacterium]